MSNQETAIEPLKEEIRIGESGLVLRTRADVKFAAETFWKAGVARQRFKNEAQVAVAILTGAEAGLSPNASLRALYPVKDIMTWETWAVRALILKSGKLQPGTKIKEGVTHHESCKGSTCSDLCFGYFETHRAGEPTPTVHTFSVADAKRANLWNKAGPWTEYPQRMLKHRACGFHGKDAWGDVLLGMDTRESVEDYPEAAFVHSGDTVATYTDPPGIDPLLARASGEEEEDGAGESQEGDVLDVEAEPTATSEEVEASEEPAPSGPDPFDAKAIAAEVAEVERQLEEEARQLLDETTGVSEPALGRDPEPEPESISDEEIEEAEAKEAAEILERDEDPVDEDLTEDPETEPKAGPVCSLCHKPINPDTDTLWREPGGDRFHCQGCGPWPKADQ